MHSGGSLMFRLMMVQELLNIEQFFQRNFNEVKLKSFTRIGVKELGQALCNVGKPLMSDISWR